MILQILKDSAVDIVNTGPDGWFWYALSVALSILLCSVLIFLLVRYSNKIDSSIDSLKENIIRLTNIQAIHGIKIEAHAKDIDLLKDKVYKA